MASDLSAYHRVDNMWCMGSRRWAQLVPRLYAYSGAVRGRMQAIMAQDEREQAVAPVLKPQAGGGGVARAADGTVLLAGPPSPLQGGREIEATQTSLAMSEIGDMFSFSTVAAPPAGT